jgi:hypothetical protein
MKNSTDVPIEIPQILRQTPSLIRGVVRCFGDDTLQWRPSLERWSAAMVITHLAESEAVCFRTRLNRAAREDGPVLEPYDQWAYLRDQSEYPVATAVKTFARERQKTLNFLSTLSTGAHSRICHHQKLGVLTFEHLLNELAFHDLGHVRQILELCRAQAYYPNMGGWQQYYAVSP